MQEYPKHIKRQLRELASQAYENERGKELAGLAAKFDEWRAGKLSAEEMSHLVHLYETGPARELYSYYVGNPMLAMLVASAIVRGLLKEEDVPAEVMPFLEGALDVCRRGLTSASEDSEEN